MWWFGNGGWLWMIGGGLMMLVFWGGLIVLAILAIRAFSGSQSTRQPGRGNSSALDILKMRYARGEITKAEYEEMKQTLEE
jgi:putative membrane protein